MDVVKSMLGWKGKDEFVENNQKKRVLIYRNGKFDDGKVIYVEAEWTLHDFFVAGSNRLNIAPMAKRVFNGNGKLKLHSFYLSSIFLLNRDVY